MNSLANEGFVILGGPLEGSPDGGGSLGEQGSTPHHPGRTLDAAARISRVQVTARRILHVSKHQNAAQLHAAATDEEIRASSLQFVRKLSGFTKPSRANEA